MARTTAQVDGAVLVLPKGDASSITVGTPNWFARLEQATTFAFTRPSRPFTAHKEQQAPRQRILESPPHRPGPLHRWYLGKAQDLTLDQLNRAAGAPSATIPSMAQPCC